MTERLAWGFIGGLYLALRKPQRLLMHRTAALWTYPIVA